MLFVFSVWTTVDKTPQELHLKMQLLLYTETKRQRGQMSTFLILFMFLLQRYFWRKCVFGYEGTLTIIIFPKDPEIFNAVWKRFGFVPCTFQTAVWCSWLKLKVKAVQSFFKMGMGFSWTIRSLYDTSGSWSSSWPQMSDRQICSHFGTLSYPFLELGQW